MSCFAQTRVQFLRSDLYCNYRLRLTVRGHWPMSLICTHLRVLSRTRRSSAHRCRRPAPQGRTSTEHLCCVRESVELRTPAAHDRARESGGAAESPGATKVKTFWSPLSARRVSSRGVQAAGARALRRAGEPGHRRQSRARGIPLVGVGFSTLGGFGTHIALSPIAFVCVCVTLC